jgi:predicted nucleic acid-binding protein
VIFVVSNVLSETLRRSPDENVIAWLARHDTALALPTVTIAEIAYGIAKIRPDERAERLERGLDRWRRRFADRIFGLTEEAALVYGVVMGEAARRGRTMSAPDGMIAAIALSQGGRLATRNTQHFATTGLDLVDPWMF